jgi:hypothetical protein
VRDKRNETERKRHTDKETLREREEIKREGEEQRYRLI